MASKKIPKQDMYYHTKKKLTLGIALLVFGFVLWAGSSTAALTTNLNWPAAFVVLGLLSILKGIYCYYQK